jgi:3-oxoacyl-[acyl-carrier-protein] synthase III
MQAVMPVRRPIAAVTGTGHSVPKHVMTNHDFASIGIETSHEWIFERSGIVRRHIARDGESTCSMAVEASQRAMVKAGISAAEIDSIILSTATPDRLLPATAVDIQAMLGARRAAAFDLSAA